MADAGSGGSMRGMGTGGLTVQLWNLKLALAYYDSCVQGGAALSGYATTESAGCCSSITLCQSIHADLSGPAGLSAVGNTQLS